MAFRHVIAGMEFNESHFEGTAYADEQTGFPKALEKIVEHVANAYRSPSSESLTVATGAQSLTAAANRPFAVGQPVRIARVSDPTGTFMDGSVTDYDEETGEMTVEVVSVRGSGTWTDWMVSVGGVSQTAAATSPLPVTDGGTGAADADGARVNLGLGNDAAGRANLGLGDLATADGPLALNQGGTGATAAAAARANLGLGNDAAGRANLGLGDLATVDAPVAVAQGGTAATDAATARANLGLGNDAAGRANLGLGDLATVSSPVPVGSGGTGATAASAARNNLGLGNVATDDVVPLGRGGTGGTNAGTARTNLGLGSIATVASPVPVVNGGTGGTTASTARGNLGLGNVATDNVVPLARGGTNATSAGAARTNLGLGSIATVGSPVPIANGGTAATSASAARNNLGLGSIATVASPVPIANGGTGATTTAQAMANLGISPPPRHPQIRSANAATNNNSEYNVIFPTDDSGWIQGLIITLRGTSSAGVTVRVYIDGGAADELDFRVSDFPEVDFPNTSTRSAYSGVIPYTLRFDSNIRITIARNIPQSPGGQSLTSGQCTALWSLD